MKIYKHNHSEVFNLFMASQLKKQANLLTGVANRESIANKILNFVGLTTPAAKNAIKEGKAIPPATMQKAVKAGKTVEEIAKAVELARYADKTLTPDFIARLARLIDEEAEASSQLNAFKQLAEKNANLEEIKQAALSFGIQANLADAKTESEAFTLINRYYLPKKQAYDAAVPGVDQFAKKLNSLGNPDLNDEVADLEKFTKSTKSYDDAFSEFSKAQGEHLAQSQARIGGGVADEAAEAVGGAEKIDPPPAKPAVEPTAQPEAPASIPTSVSKMEDLTADTTVKITSVDGNDVKFKIGENEYKGRLSDFKNADAVREGESVDLNRSRSYEIVSDAEFARIDSAVTSSSEAAVTYGKDAIESGVELIDLGEDNGRRLLLNKKTGRTHAIPKDEFDRFKGRFLSDEGAPSLGKSRVFKAKSRITDVDSRDAGFFEKFFPNLKKSNVGGQALSGTGAAISGAGGAIKGSASKGKDLVTFLFKNWKATLAFGAVAGVIYWLTNRSNEAKQESKKIKADQVAEDKRFIEADKNIKFKPGSNGEKVQQKFQPQIEQLVAEIESNPLESEEDQQKYLQDTAKLAQLKSEYETEFAKIQKEDFVDPGQKEEAQSNFDQAKTFAASIADRIGTVIDKAAEAKDKEERSKRTQEEGIGGGISRGGERDSTKEPTSSLPKFKSQKISIPKILGPTKTIEIGDLPVNEQFEIRNLIVPLIQEGNPATMAFIDPANAGTGYFASTVDPVSDLKKDLRFMAQQGLTNPAKIRTKLKQKFNSRDDRRVLRKSRRFYKKNRGEDFSSQYISDETGIPESANNSSQFSENNSGMMEAAANDGFTSNASRKKNLLNIFKQSKISINNQTKIMNKQAQQQDSFIDLYFKDAVKGVEDAYAKAYFAGLNSMQDFDSKKEPDYSNLYDVHKETGEDLILSAHPTVSKPVEAKGDGGVVENALEQHRKMLDIAFNVPSGNFRSKQAFVIGELVKIANLADENGNLEAASLIDEFLQEFVESK